MYEIFICKKMGYFVVPDWFIDDVQKEMDYFGVISLLISFRPSCYILSNKMTFYFLETLVLLFLEMWWDCEDTEKYVVYMQSTWILHKGLPTIWKFFARDDDVLGDVYICPRPLKISS